MSTIGGSFDETILMNQLVKATEIGFDSRIKQQFTPQYAVVDAIKAAQTAVVQTSLSKKKDVAVEVQWENFCDIVAEECATDCTIGGTKSSTNVEEYDVTWCKEVNFSFDENDFYDNVFDMNVAKAFLKADKEITEAFAQYAVAKLEAFKGVNVLADNSKGTVAGTETTIPAAYWTPSLAAYFNRVSIMNKFVNPIFLSGSLLYESYITAQAMAANANGKGDWAMWAGLQPYWDMFNIDTVNTPDLKAYLISMGSVAIGSKNINPDIPVTMFDMTKYTMTSQFLGIKYDVFYNNSCSGTQKMHAHNYTVRAKADIWLNPAGCLQTNTGILSFKCG